MILCVGLLEVLQVRRWAQTVPKIKIHKTRTKEDNQITKTLIISEEYLVATRVRIRTMEAFVTHLTKRTTATCKMIHTTTGTTTRHKITEEARNRLFIKMPLCRIRCTSSSSLHQRLQLCLATVAFSPGQVSKAETSCLKMTLQTAQWVLVWTTWMNSLVRRRKCKIRRLTNNIMVRCNHGSLHKIHTKGSIQRIAKMVATTREVIPQETIKTSQ